MVLKAVYGVIAAALVVVYLAAPAIKLKDPALTAVIIIGILMMLIDLWQSMKSKDD